MSISIAAIAVGSLAAIGTAGAIWHASTEDDRAREKIKQLKAANEQLSLQKDYINNIKSKLVNAKDYLNLAKSDFKKGGHVMDNVPLANSEFTSCIKKIDEAINNSTNMITDFEADIAQNKKEIKKQEAKLD